MILVTGAAGFIGSHVARCLAERGEDVVGIDNINDYYDPSLKEARLGELAKLPTFRFERLDLADRDGMAHLFATAKPARVIHLAAQAGVRYSLVNPFAYTESNVTGFLNILEGCRQNGTGHLVFASSSSVYGMNGKQPFSVHDPVDHPVSLYAATKKANELMAHAYAALYKLPVTGLRFFTVYGAWGRPDMAYFLFTKAILEGRPIQVFNHGQMKRDFTYIDDVVEAVVKVADHVPAPDPTWNAAASDAATSFAPYRVYNIGNHQPVPLMDLIQAIEDAAGAKAQLVMKDMQPGDVYETYADVEDLMRDVGFAPSTPLREGIGKFVAWYREFYGA
jgi:UDP-glucuronate 4-epimerase